MKKLLSLILCLCLLATQFTFLTFAQDSGDPIDTTNHTNIALEAIPSVFSNYYDYSKASYLNDNIIDGQINSYMFWRPQTSDRDPSVAGTDPWFRYKFKEYKEISKITVLVEIPYSTETVVKFEALIQGEWILLGIEKYSESPQYKEYEKVHEVSLELPYGVTTKEIRVSVSGYIVWDPPMISECIVMGADGKAPEFDVPEGAYMTTNAVLSGTASASSSKARQYPALANDDNFYTKWASNDTTNNQWYQVDFDKEYTIGEVGMNLSAIKLVLDTNENPVNEVYKYTVKIEINVNGKWETAYEGEVSTSEGSDAVYKKALDSAKKVSAIKVTYLNTNGISAMLSELYATISDGTKCMCPGSSVTPDQKLSAASGNVACLGTPYASSVFTFSNMSDVKYITDGRTGNDDYIWVPETPACPSYCGVVLDKARTVDNVVLYFNDAFGIDADGKNHVSTFDVQYKNSKGEYVTVTSASSYDSKYGKAIISLSFDAVTTDDIRVVFKTNGGTFPYLKELEVYSHSENNEIILPYTQFVGFPASKRIPAATKEFKNYTVAKRPERLNVLKKVPMNSAPVTDPKASGWTGWK
ncbi:MAG: discoidin domain-containing protein [Clostridia bacterium]|nr:discoidin domain-containing protein [Clostridia bacterium]